MPPEQPTVSKHDIMGYAFACGACGHAPPCIHIEGRRIYGEPLREPRASAAPCHPHHDAQPSSSTTTPTTPGP